MGGWVRGWVGGWVGALCSVPVIKLAEKNKWGKIGIG
jgi:hypothetical protein